MGRKPKKGVDYFSHDCDASTKPTLFTMQERFGNDGYAFWFKLLEFLGQRENLSFDCNVTSEWLFFVAKAKVTETLANDMLNTLASIDAIDAELWQHRIVWSKNFVERVEDVYRKRGTLPPSKPMLEGSHPQDVDNIVDEPQDSVPEQEPIAPQEEQAKGTKKSKKPKEEKTRYATYVHMKTSEYKTLCTNYGKDATDKAIAILDNYKGSKGKTYKDDYRAILSWVIEKIKREFPHLIRPEQNQNIEENDDNPFASFM